MQPQDDLADVQGSTAHNPIDEEVDEEHEEDSRDPRYGPKSKKIPDSLVGNLCTAEEKELSDLRRKGLLDDGARGEIKGDFTLNDLPQLRGDEACSVQWTTSKRKAKESIVGATEDMCGLSDDELASVLQACPDLEGVISKP